MDFLSDWIMKERISKYVKRVNGDIVPQRLPITIGLCGWNISRLKKLAQAARYFFKHCFIGLAESVGQIGINIDFADRISF